MTRDEAVEIAKKSKDDWGGGSSEFWLVNAMVALGVLNLEEQNLESRESPNYKAYEALFEHIPSLDFQTFRDLIKSAGLQIIEKGQ